MLIAQAVTMPVGLQVGVGGIFALMIIRMVFDFVDRQRAKKNGSTLDLRRVCDQIKDLHRWHQPDDHGEQTWKNTRMIRVLEDTTKLMREHHIVLKQLIPVMERVTEALTSKE